MTHGSLSHYLTLTVRLLALAREFRTSIPQGVGPEHKHLKSLTKIEKRINKHKSHENMHVFRSHYHSHCIV